MRIACYNVEWFTRLFDEAGNLQRDQEWSARHDITRAQQIEALGNVFRVLDADAIMVIEAPDASDAANRQERIPATVRALENFARAFDLRARRAVMGFPNSTQQEIALLYNPDVLSARHDPIEGPSGRFPRFDEQFEIDLDVDARSDAVAFSKPPLELELRRVSDTGQGKALRMIGVHLKSKAPHGARGRDEVMRVSIANRRKQLAQALWLRGRIEQHLADGTPLIVLGDLNDGPGLDEYEGLFGRSSVEIVLGEGETDPLFDPHAARALERKISASYTTARFYIKPEKRYLQALLDYIMVSSDLRSRSPVWRIWHPFDDPYCWKTPKLRDALLIASDHYPVSLDLEM